jgi:hypothetical protein
MSDPTMGVPPESIRIEIRMPDHVKVIELFPGDGGFPPLKATFDWNREAIEVPNPDGLPWRHFEPSAEVDVTLKATCGRMTYAREERPSEGRRG